MKQTAIVITLLVLLIAGGYLAYEKWYHPAPTSLWDNVPDNAVLVFESKNTIDSWNKLTTLSLWNSLQHIPSFENIKTDLELLDSIEGRSGSIAKLLQGNSLLSLHVINKNDFDWIYFVDLSSEDHQRIATKILNHFKSSSTTQFSERVYQGINISEISNEGKTFSYYVENNVLVGSYTSFLVEDVVRVINNNYQNSFNRSNKPLFDLPKLSNDDGNIYLNMDMASLWLGAFVGPDYRQDLKSIRDFSRSGFFDMAVSDDKVLLNGFTLSDIKNNYLSCLRNQKPVKTNIKYFIPNRAAVLYQFSLSDAVVWHNDLARYWSQNESVFMAERTKFQQDYSFDFSRFYGWIGNNVGLVNLESSYRSGNEKLTFVHANDITEALNHLNTFSESLAQVHGDSVYVESFSKYQLRELKLKNFPRLAFGPLFTGFDECYFTAIDDYIVIGTSMLALKGLIEDIENEETWGRSVAYNTFLESNLEESNLSLIFNTTRLWDDLLVKLNPKWKQFAEQYATEIKSFALGSIQFSKLDENFYTSLAIQYKKQPELNKKQTYQTLHQAHIGHQIITKPYVVKNHVTRRLEVAVQDSAYNFVLIGEEGNILWRDSLGQPIISEIEQIDYYKNGKMQYFFATPSALHVIDRLGNYVEDYPIAVPNRLKYASVIDYDNSKNYRFLLGDERGNLFLYNKEGINLEGWMPRELTGKLATKPFHLRVRGKDCIVAIQQNGVVNVMTRRGEMLPGFPLKLDSRISTSSFTTIGSDFDKTTLTVLTNDGELVNFNLKGIIVSTEQLYKPAKESTFKLVPDALEKTYIIARQDLNRLVLLTPGNQEVLAKDYLNSDNLTVQYYDLSSDHKIYVITDGTQGFSYIYNKDGKLINSTPINSEHMIGLMYFDSARKYHVYATSGDTFKLLTF